MATLETVRGIDATLAYEAWLDLPETNVPFEVVDGRPVVTPPTAGPHQLVLTRLQRCFTAGLPDGFEVVQSPIAWVLRRAPLLVREPDLVVAPLDALRRAPLHAPPLVAVEVLSPSNAETDRVTKRREYAEAGLAWYWIVDLERPEIAVFDNQDATFVLHASAVGSERLHVTDPFPVTVRPADLVA